MRNTWEIYMKNKIILCTGGTRSGKSQFAEQLALSIEGKKVYIATAKVFDEEMQYRVEQHKIRRGKEWVNKEAHEGLSHLWHSISSEGDVFLMDCVTMYITNYVLQLYNGTEQIMDQAEQINIKNSIMGEMKSLLIALEKTTAKTIIFVTNELGWSIVPDNPLGRLFRDIVGEVNQLLGAHADEVYLSISGITMEIKERSIHIHGKKNNVSRN